LTKRGVSVIGDPRSAVAGCGGSLRSIKDAASEAASATARLGVQSTHGKALGRPWSSAAGGPGGGDTTLTDECTPMLARYHDLRSG